MAGALSTVKYQGFSAHFLLWRKSSSLKNLAFSFWFSHRRQLVVLPPFSSLFLFSQDFCASDLSVSHVHENDLFNRFKLRLTKG